MELPIKITPCPIKIAVIELRFEPSVDRDAVFGILYRKLNEIYTNPPEKLAILQFPEQFRDTDPDLKYQPYYRFKHQNFTVSIGPNVMSVSAVREYPGWNELKSEFIKVYKIVEDSNITQNYTRFALRYINEIKGDITNQMKWKLSLGTRDLTTLPINITTVIADEGVTSTFRFQNDAADLEGARTTLIDIDSVLDAPVSDFEKRISEHLDEVHQAEKRIFFSALKEEYLNTLNPEYAV